MTTPKPKLFQVICVASLIIITASCAYARLEETLGMPFGMPANADCNNSPDALDRVKEAGSFDVIIFQWPEAHALKELIKLRAEQGRARGLKVLLGISPTKMTGLRTDIDMPAWVASSCGLTDATASFADNCLRSAFIADVSDYADYIKPDYFHLATEINTLLLRLVVNPFDVQFSSFATLYKEAYSAVKAVSPNTAVFVSFQYELQKRIDRDAPASVSQNWDNTLNPFRGDPPGSMLDYVGFTTYPSSSGFLSWDYQSPLDVPATYYLESALHLRSGERTVFTEAGWPSSGPGTEAGQKMFLDRLPMLFSYANPAMACWALLHDVDPAVFGGNLGLASVGLRSCDGSPKQAWGSIMAVAPGEVVQGGARVGSTGGKGVVHPLSGERAEIQVKPAGPGRVKIKIFTLEGRLVREFSWDTAGPSDPKNNIQWDTANKNGQRVASGVYLIHIDGPGLNVNKKLVIIK